MDHNPLSDIDENKTDHLMSEESTPPGAAQFSSVEQRRNFLADIVPEETGDSGKSGSLFPSNSERLKAKSEATEKPPRIIHRIGINAKGERVEWIDPLPDSMEDRLAKMPIDNSEAYFAWLKDFHGEKYTTILREADEMAPNDYNYEGVDQESLTKAFEAIKTQRQDEPGKMRQILSELDPAQISILVISPTKKLLTTEERAEEFRRRKSDTIGRLREFRDFQEIAKPVERIARYIHSTSSPETAEMIMQHGLNAHEPQIGLNGVAVGLGTDYEANLRDIAMTHRGYNYEVVVALPKPTEKVIDQIRGVYFPGTGRLSTDGLYVEELENKVELHGAGLDYSHRIPSEFIEGYLDQTNGSFISNPNYWENALRTEQSQNGWSQEEFDKKRGEKLASFEQRTLERVDKLKSEIEEINQKPRFRSEVIEKPSPSRPTVTEGRSGQDVW